MTKLQISMALSALTITLAPQVQAYATADDMSLAEPVLARFVMTEPLLSEPGPAVCQMQLLERIVNLPEQAMLPPDVEISQLACHAE